MTLRESFVAYQLTGLWLDSQDSHVHSKLTRLRAEERKKDRESMRVQFPTLPHRFSQRVFKKEQLIFR